MKGKKAIQSKFPTARIKKIMQEDEEIGKVAQSTPLVISKALELFLRDIVTESCEIARVGGSKKLMPYHVKRLGQQNRQYDFLDPLLQPISDPLGSSAPMVAPQVGAAAQRGNKKAQAASGSNPSAGASASGAGSMTAVKTESKPVGGSVGGGAAGGGQVRQVQGGPSQGAKVEEDDYDEDEDSDESE